MSEWQKATMDNLFYNPKDKPDFDDECLVRFDPGTLTVKYDCDGETVVWHGIELSPGHYKLESPEVDGKATLHRFPQGDVLIGEWIEEGERGMWRIEFAQSDQPCP